MKIALTDLAADAMRFPSREEAALQAARLNAGWESDGDFKPTRSSHGHHVELVYKSTHGDQCMGLLAGWWP